MSEGTTAVQSHLKKEIILEPWIWAYCGAEADNSSQGSGLCLSPAQRISEPAETQWVRNAAVPKPDPGIITASWH